MLISKQKWDRFKERELFTCILVSLLIQGMIEKNFGNNGKIFKWNLETDSHTNNI
jgi:hypothetical protein